MRARIPADDHTALQKISKAANTSMSNVVRLAVAKAIAGEIEIPTRLPADKETTFVVAHHDEEALKALAKAKNMSVDELVRYAIHEVVSHH